MPQSELRKKFEEVLRLAIKQKELFLKKVESVDHAKAVEDASQYESFMPSLEEFQEDLDFINSKTYEIIEEVGDKIIGLYDGIEGVFSNDDGEELEDVSTEEDVELTPEQESRIFDVDENAQVEVESELKYPDNE